MENPGKGEIVGTFRSNVLEPKDKPDILACMLFHLYECLFSEK